MKKGVIIALVIAVAVIAYLALKGGKPADMNESPSPSATVSSTSSPKASPTSEGMKKTVTVQLSAQNSSGETGTAILTEKDGKVTVSVRTVGEPAGASQPAHIHTGSCPTPGAVVHPLTNVVDNKSETTLTATLEQLKNAGPLAINLHKSATESSVYVACGNITF